MDFEKQKHFPVNHIDQWRYEFRYNIIYRTYRQLKYDYCHKQQQNESNRKYGANRFANAWSQISHCCSNLHIRKTMILRYVILEICKYNINFGAFRANKIIFTSTSWKCMIFTAVVQIANSKKFRFSLRKIFYYDVRSVIWRFTQILSSGIGIWRSSIFYMDRKKLKWRVGLPDFCNVSWFHIEIMNISASFKAKTPSL